LERERGRQLECSLASVGKLTCDRAGVSVQVDRSKQLERPPIENAQSPLRAPEVKRVPEPPLESDAHVFEHGKLRKDGGDLERADQSSPRHSRGTQLRDVFASIDDGARGRRKESREQVEDSRLAGAVRPDQSVNGATADSQVD